MTPVVLVDTLALVAYLAAGVFLATPRGRSISSDLWWVLAALAGISALYEFSNLMETAGLSLILEPFEDLLGMLQPIAWGALLYAYEQSAARREGVQRENLLSAALDGGRLGAWEWHVRTGYVAWFGLSESIFGFDPGRFPNTLEAVRERVHPDDIEPMWRDVERALETDDPYQSTYRIVWPSGEVRWVEATGVVHRDSSDGTSRMVGTVRDVTDEHQTRLERERLADIIESTTDFVGTASPEGEVLYLNPAARALLGIPAGADLSGRVFRELHPEWAVRLIENEGIPAAIRDGVWSAESAVLATDGREIPVSQLIIAHRMWDGHAIYLSTVIRDISASKRAEAVLQESEERFRAFTSIAADWVWEMGPDQRFRYVSERIEELTGLPASHFIGRTRAELGDFGDNDEALRRHLADLAAHRPFRNFRYRSVTSDGEVHWYETSGEPVFDDDGRFAGYRGTGREVTAEVQALEAVRESEERFRNLIEGSIQGIFIHRDFEPLFVNRAFARMLGFDNPGQILAMPSIEPLFAPGEVERMRRYNAKRLAGDPNAPTIYEFEAVRRDGSRIVLQNTARRVSWRGRTAIQAAAVDVTERREAEQQLRNEIRFSEHVIDSLPGVFYLFDDRGKYLRWNRALETITGYSGGEIETLSPLDLFMGEEREYVSLQIERVLEKGDATAEADLVARDGTRHPYFFSGHRIMLEGRPCVVGMGIDIGELKTTEAALRASKARYRALYEDNPSMYLTLDAGGVVRSINSYGAEQLGYDAGRLIGVPARSLYPDDDRDAFDRMLGECLNNPGTPQRWELPKLRADGSVLWVRETARAVHDAAGDMVVLVVSEDASEARDLSERLAYEATHDGLTDLINRREFEKRLGRLIETPRLPDAEHVLCYLDLDQFKIVNDTCGHMAGDELLRQLGGVFRKHVRQDDTLARLGGDEFALLLENCPMSQATRVANKLRRVVEDYRFQWEDHSFKIGVSIGLVPIDASIASSAQVLGMADSACYVAKDLGRNRVHVYREDDDAIAQRTGEMQWVRRLDAALEHNRFRLVHQRIAPTDGESRGEHYELLLRMQDDDGRLISPASFLPAAERYNVSGRLDRWVLDAALRWLSGDARDLEDLYLCGINLSGHSLTDEDFLAFAIERIRSSQVPADKLCFEITETAAIANFAGAQRFIIALRDLGCVFALDDFGSGLSSFGYLKTLPVDFLKIDGSFVKDILHDPIDRSMVEAINRVGKVMGKRTIAEFVESGAVLDLLREIGVDFVQGYHVHRPEPLRTRVRHRPSQARPG